MIKRFRVKSRSRKGVYHIVEIDNIGNMSCDCEAGSFGRPCHHKKIVEEYYKKNGQNNREN